MPRVNRDSPVYPTREPLERPREPDPVAPTEPLNKGWQPKRGVVRAPVDAASPNVGIKSATRVPVTPELTALGQAVLQARGAPSTADDARKLLEGNGALARRLSTFSAQYRDSPAAATQAALRHLRTNAPGTVPEPAGSEAATQAYAKDLGYWGVTFNTRNGHAALWPSAPTGGPEDKTKRIDLGAFQKTAKLSDIGQAINNQRFATPTIVPPSAFHAGADFHIDNAHVANHLSSLAYFDKDMVERQLKDWGFDTSTFRWIENKDTDTQGFVVNDRSGNTFVTFRGTEKNQKDAQTDLQRTLVSPGWGDPKMKVHEGFAKALESVWPDVQEALAHARADAGKGEVMFSGHSLGGALATLAALRADSERRAPTGSATHVYTVGAPRVGDPAFVDAYNQRLPGTHRLVNYFQGRQDVFTQIPPQAMGYRHVGDMVTMNDEGLATIPRGDARSGFVPMDAGATVSEVPSGIGRPERRDPTDPEIERMSAPQLQQYLEGATEGVQGTLLPSDSAQNRSAIFPTVITELTLRALAHSSGRYLARTGPAVLAQ